LGTMPDYPPPPYNCYCGAVQADYASLRMSRDKHLPLLSVAKEGDGDENHSASNESVSLVMVVVVVEYSTPPQY